MRNLYLVVTATFLLAACGGGSGGGTSVPAPDTVAPTVTAPSAAVFAAVDAAGTPASSDGIAAFLQGATATDDVDGSVSVINDAPDVFSLGDTTVTFSASDVAGNTGTASAVVTVTDQAAPALSVPADSSFVATSAAGIAASDTALVDFLAQATASDNVDAAITVSNDAPSTFPIGDTTVTFSAADAAGNTNSGSAVVTVTGASQSGTAEKGPLFNATVFFDYDGDKELDANEPSTLTDVDGRFELSETSDAPADYTIVMQVNEDTIDSISGESYADSGVTLEAVKGSTVITPMTTLYSLAVTDLDEGEELSVEAFSVALGLPSDLDVNTYSAFAKDTEGEFIDVAVAAQVEAVAQSLMTTLEVISESIVSISQTALKSGEGISQTQAAAVALKSLVNVVVATVAENAAAADGVVADAVDLSNVADIAEVNAEVLESLNSAEADSLGALLETAAEEAGVIVDKVAAEVTGSVVLTLSTDTIAAVSQAFADLSAESFGQVEASAVSLIKAQAVAEIAIAAEIVVAAVTEQQEDNVTVVLAVEDVDVSAVITLDNQESLNAAIEINVQEVEAYLLTTVAPVIDSASSFVAVENQTAVGTVLATDTAGSVLSYSLSGADEADLNISDAGVLSFVSAPDFETKALYEVVVTVLDSDGNSVSQAISISIADANDSAPIISSSSSFEVNEGESEIGRVVASSPSSLPLTFKLSGSDAGDLSISNDGVLGFNAVPDFEVKSSYAAIVTVSDGANETISAITVSVVNLNDSDPVIISESEFTVDENSKFVGILKATDADFDRLVLTLSGADAGAFSLSSTGVLRFVVAPDFEKKASFELGVTATDGENSVSQNITVVVADIDDVAPVFTSAAAFSAVENQTSVGTVTATDVDSAEVTFSVISTELAISPGGVLSFIAAADFEAKSVYSVTVTATDGANASSQVVTVTVLDADDSAPVISSSPAFNVAENQTAIGTVVATDAGSVTFSITGTELLINSAGVVSFASAPDFEAKSTYTATVTVTDANFLTTSQNITVAVTNLDDVAPVFTSATAFSAAENQTSIGIVAATDVDSPAVTFSVSSSEIAISDTGVLSFIGVPDFETKSVYSVTVVATDGTNVSSQVVTVTVLDADDSAPVISSSPVFSAAENQTAVGTVVAIDAGSVSFSISGTELVISSAGVVSFVSAPDFETKATYSATVTVTDAGSLTTSQTITVAITNIDDVAPVFTSVAAFSAVENQTSIGTVTATDVDSAAITFSVSDSEIAISDAGVLSFIAVPDFEAKSTYSVTVIATDGTNLASQVVTVAVVDADDAAPVISSSPAFSAAENQTSVGAVVATDAGAVSFAISGTELVISSAGAISFAAAPDFETKAMYTAVVTVTDAGSLSTSQNITVVVTNIDDVSPVFTSAAAFSAVENQTSIGTVTATDVDSAAVTFSVSSTELAISNGGVLSFVTAADFETKSTYSVTVVATDGINTTSQLVTVTVTDADDTAPVISSSPAFDAAENQTAVGAVAATDASAVTYSISGTELIVSSTGVISFVSEPDFEFKTTYTATVTVTDAGSLSTSQNITVAVTNVDDVAPEFTSAATFSASENQTSIATVTAFDVDSDAVTFSVSSTELAISAGGVLSFVTAADFETKSTYTVTVTASDGTNTTSQVVTVTVLDADDTAPVISSSPAFSAAENQTAVGTVVASDASAVSFSITGAELVISSTGVISFVSAPDFEVKPTYTATVIVTDGVNETRQNITVAVTNVDDVAPVFTSATTFSAAENQTFIGAVTATDVDSDSVTFTVSSAELAISNGGVLSFVTAADFEAKSSYLVTVTATDGINTTSQVVTVTVLDIDDTAPVIISSPAFDAAENQTAVGTVVAIDASAVTFSITGTKMVISATGVISFASAPDFETKATYTATVTVTDSNGTSTSQNITVTVINVDDVGPVFTSATAFSAAENQTSIGTLTATDVDSAAVTFSVSSTELAISAGGVLSFVTAADFETKSTYTVTVTASDGTNTTNQVVTVTVLDADDTAPLISSSPAFSAAENQTAVGTVVASDASAVSFSISGADLVISSTGVISFVSAPDFEVKPTYTATVIVTDGVNETRQNITVAVTNVDDVAPVFTSATTFSAAENQTFIGAVTATDVDSDSVTFTVSSAELEISNGGVLSFVTAADFEAKSSYLVTVTATDGINTTSQVVTVTVLDIDDTAPVIISSPAFDAAENQTAAGTVVAIDASAITFSITGTEMVISATGAISFASAPDFEAKATYTATVTVTDSNGNSTSQNITVTVINVDDVGPVFTSATAFSASENQTSIGTLTATDVDSAAVTFSVSSTELAISAGGVLSFVTAADFETKSTYTVTVTASDGTNTTNQVVTVTVLDADDTAPVIFSSPAFSAAENQTAVGRVMATDSSAISFSITGSDLVISSTGVISFASAPDFETKVIYTATVTVTDAGSLTTSQNITIAVTDVDDVAPVFTSAAAFSALENQTSIGTVTATDIDSSAVSFSVSSTELAISAGGVLSFINAADFEIKSAYSVTITATDGTNTTNQVVSVTVVDADDTAPVISSSPAFSAAENQLAVGSVAATDTSAISFSISGTELVISSAGVISFASAPDFETKTSFTATVTVTDTGSFATSQSITVTITDVDDVAPVFTSAVAFSAYENQTSIGTLTASDVDSAAVTFSVSSSELAISAGGVLSFVNAADFETKAAYSATVTASDGTNTTNQVVTVTVLDADDTAPVISSSPTFNAAENQTAAGTVVATDAGSVSFSITGTELLISSTGVVSFVSAPDFEVKPTYTATVIVTDGINETRQNITVAVTNVDDVAPVISSGATFTALDSQANLGVVVATDVDSTSITYSISGSELAISSAGVISFVSVSDFVADKTYTATVTLTDGGSNVTTQDISVAVFLDFDGDGIANITDTDDDGDGILDLVDDYPLIASSFAVKAPLYLARAYHDCNANEKFDEATEPFALTETDGSYHIDGNCGAVTSFNTVVEMTPDTIDYESGESYGATAVQLKAEYSAAGSSVNTPLTTLLKHIEQFEGDPDDVNEVAIESISSAQLSLALGLPDTVDLLTFNPYAPNVNASLAHDVETISQKIMLVTLVVTEAIEGAGTSASGASVTDDIAHEAILDALSKVVIETIKVQEGKLSNHIGHVLPPDASLTGEAKRAAQKALKVNLADREHLVELFEFLDEDAASGHLRDALDLIGADVPVAVLTAITDKTSEIISNIAVEFDGHGESAFSSAETHITSHLKHDAAEEIFAFARGYRAYYDIDQDSSFAGVQPRDFLTLDGPTGIADARALILAEVEQHALDKITDTDGDGILNVLDLDDDNDGVADIADAFPRDANESADSDSDGVGDNADTFRLSDTAVTLTDFYPVDALTVTTTVPYTVVDGMATVDLRSAPLNLTNIRNSIAGTNFKAPVISFGLANLPTGSGRDTVTIDLVDGLNSTVDSGERQVQVKLDIEWQSDGTSSVITIPQQMVTAFYKTKAGVRIDVQVFNVDSDILTVTRNGAAYPSTLEVKVVSLLTKLSALPMADILSAGTYHVNVTTSLPIKAATGETLGGVSAIVEIADAFRLSSAPVTLTDFYPLDGTTVTNSVAYAVVDGMATVDLRSAPLNLTNIRNSIAGTNFKAPVISFGLANLPTGSGRDTVTIDLVDGLNSTVDSGERQVQVKLDIEWQSDGTSSVITIPQQMVTAFYKTRAGVRIDVQVFNVDSDILTVTSNGAAYPSTLEVKVVSLLTKLSALPMADILSAGTYHVNVTTSLPIKAATGETLGGVSAIVEIADAFKLADATVTLQDPNAVDGSITSSTHEAILVDGFLTVDMRNAPLSLLNIEKGLFGLDFTSPKVLFGLSAIPSGTGTERVTVNLIDGTDATRDSGERQVTVALDIEWDANGSAAAITVPAQNLSAYYLTGNGTKIDVVLNNADLDVLSVSSTGAAYPVSLELKLLSLITKLSGLPLADLLSAGVFHIDVTTTMPMIASTGQAVDGLKAVIEIADDVAPLFTSATTFSAAENQTAVGTVAAVAFDNGSISYSISGSDLQISSAGVVSFISAPDYEGSASYTATVTATSGNRSTAQVVTVNVTDRDDTFTLSDAAVTLTDYYPLDGSTVTNTLAYTVANGRGNVDLRAAPLNLTNIKNSLYAGDFRTPVISFGLSTLPIGSGAGTVSIDLIDGVDSVVNVGERQVNVELNVLWESDGTTASITVPAQMINASYKTSAGVQIDVQVSNVDADVLTVTGDGVTYPATLDVKLMSLITQLSALPLADILNAGVYHVDVTTSLPLKAATGETLGGVSAIVEIADAFKLADATVTLQDPNAVDGSITSSTHEAILVDGFLTVDMRNAPLSLLNIEKGLFGLDFTSPKVLFGLSAIPSGTGTERVTVNLIDGTDATRDSGERQVTVALDIEWDANGSAAAITVPAQNLSAYYLTGNGTKIDVVLNNADLDVLSVSSTGAAYPVSLELKLLSLITKLSGLPLADLLSAGVFHIDVTTTMPMIASTGQAVDGLKAVIEIADDVAPLFTSATTFSAAENQTAVGTVAAVAFDNGSISYSISGSDLQISSAGVVSFISAPDYEGSASYTATVTATSGNRSTAQVVTVNVTDRDDTFTLSDAAVTLTDYYPLDGSTVTNTLAYTVANGRGNVDLRAAPLNLTNIKNSLYAGDFRTPVISFGLSTLPIGSGAGTVAIDLIDGVDSVVNVGERQVNVELNVLWESDGTTASITVPAQMINASYKTSAGVQIDVQVSNVDADVLTVTGDGVTYPATLDVKLMSLITQLSALPLADILNAGVYHVDVTTSLPLKAATGETLGGVSAIVEIADAFKLADATVTLQDPNAVDGSITSSTHEAILVDGFLTVDMRNAPLSLLNIEKGLFGLDFTSPKVLFGLSAIPSGTGTERVTVNLIDGTDATRDSGERQVTVALDIEWDANGSAAAITVPAQNLSAYYLTGNGTKIDVVLNNADLDVLSVSSTGAAYPVSLELKLLSLITKLSGLPLANLLSAGVFHLEVITSLPMIAPAGLAVDGLKAVIEIN